MSLPGWSEAIARKAAWNSSRETRPSLSVSHARKRSNTRAFDARRPAWSPSTIFWLPIVSLRVRSRFRVIPKALGLGSRRALGSRGMTEASAGTRATITATQGGEGGREEPDARLRPDPGRETECARRA